MSLPLLAIPFSPRVYAQANATGTITGSVINESTRKVLERATISLEGTDYTTLSGPDGSFRLTGVPAGHYTLRAGYADLSPATASVDVSAASDTSVRVALKPEEVIHLGEFRVAAEREGNAYAVQQQKNAESFRNVVSADAFGVVSDSNPGEFLKLMPGIQMDYTGIEPRGILIRGMENNLNLVMINGNQAPAAASSSTNRNFEFDQITIDNIESIEVFKAPIPSMPANAIGGTVNMITRSAFLQQGRRINATVNVTGNSDALSFGKSSGPSDKPTRKIHPGGSFTYSNSFLDNRLGVVFSVSQVNVNGLGGTAYNDCTYVSPPAAPAFYPEGQPAYINRLRREDFQTITSRSGASLNLDYKVSEFTKVFLRTTYTDHDYQFRSRFFNLLTGTLTGADLAASNATHTQVTSTGTAQQNTSMGDKRNKASTVNLGAEHRWDGWTVKYDGAVSRATNHYGYLPRMFGGITLVIPNIGFTLDKTSDDTALARITQTSGPDIYNLANYRLPTSTPPASSGGSVLPTVMNSNGAVFTTSNRDSEDMLTTGKFSVRHDFAGARPFYVEAGGSYQRQERSIQQPNHRWTYVGPDGIYGTADDTTNVNLQQFAELDYTPNIWFGERAPNAWISPFRMAQFFGQSPQSFVEDQAYAYQQAYINNRRISETIYAAYLMGNVKIGKLEILPGIRLEDTRVDGEGARLTGSAPNGNSATLSEVISKYTRTHATNHYRSNPFKYLHLTYHATNQLQLRASYTEAIGRPNFGSIIPGLTIDDSARTVTANNTGLLPQRAKNYDFSAEWYPGRTASVSAAWFRKDIKDYINNNIVTISSAMPELGIGPEYVGYSLATSFNLGSAVIEGVELSGRYQLTFLPGPLRGLEVFGNYTKLYKTEGTFAAANAGVVYDKLTNVSPQFWNVGVNFTTPGGKWFFSLRTNFLDDTPRNITGRPQEQTDARQIYEGEIRYNIDANFSLSLAGRNITSEQEGGSQLGRAIRQGTGGGAALTLTLAARF